MKKSIIFVCLFLLLVSCSTDNIEDRNVRFTHNNLLKKQSSFKSPLKIAVQTWEDQRETEGKSYELLNILPLAPYGSVHAPRPENIYRYKLNFRPDIDLAQALSNELDSYSVFNKVSYTDRTYPKDVDYIVTCKMKKNYIHSRYSVYGISIAPSLIEKPNYFFNSYYLWRILETDFATIKMDFEINIKEIKSNKIIHTKTFEKEIFKISHFITITKVDEEFYIQNKLAIEEIANDIVKYFSKDKK